MRKLFLALPIVLVACGGLTAEQRLFAVCSGYKAALVELTPFKSQLSADTVKAVNEAVEAAGPICDERNVNAIVTLENSLKTIMEAKPDGN